MTLPTNERILWHYGAHTAEPKIDSADSLLPNFVVFCGTWISITRNGPAESVYTAHLGAAICGGLLGTVVQQTAWHGARGQNSSC